MDEAKLTDWLDRNIPELGDGPLVTEMIHGGTSNVIFSLDRGSGKQMVLRRPPAVPPPGSEKTILREARVLEALNATDVPHPHCYGWSDDRAILGQPFYVMDRVAGWTAFFDGRKAINKAPFDTMPYEYGVAFAMVDALIRLANVDYKAIGLADYGKPDNFLERQVDRWANQLASYKRLYDYPGRELPGYDVTEAWLRANTPKGYKPGIMHGDVATTNMIFTETAPVRCAAMIDWELSTIGDPLIDIAWMCNALRDERLEGMEEQTAVTNVAHWPTRQVLAQYYAAGTGRDVSEFDYYLLLARFKGACIIEYKVAQAHAGILSREVGDNFSRMVLSSFKGAAEMIRMIS